MVSTRFLWSQPSSLRLDPIYIKLYLLCTNLAINGIIPATLLITLNLLTFLQVLNFKKVLHPHNHHHRCHRYHICDSIIIEFDYCGSTKYINNMLSSDMSTNPSCAQWYCIYCDLYHDNDASAQCAVCTVAVGSCPILPCVWYRGG